MGTFIFSVVIVLLGLAAVAVIFTENIYHIQKTKDSIEEESETKEK